MKPTMLSKMLSDRDFQGIAGFLKRFVDIDVSPELLKKQCLAANAPHFDAVNNRGQERADDTIVMWLKNRLESTGAFAAGKNPPPIEHPTAVLHVHFLFIAETPEQLARLKFGEPEIKSCVARSKISSTNLADITAIDRVAGQVVPESQSMQHRTEETITVCSACLTASCWQGRFFCDRHKTAGTVEKTRAELEALDLEHPDYWTDNGRPG